MDQKVLIHPTVLKLKMQVLLGNPPSITLTKYHQKEGIPTSKVVLAILQFKQSYFSTVTHTLQKAKRRVEDRFSKFVLKRGKKKDGSTEESSGACNT